MSSETPPTVICVFCGASPGSSPAHLQAARDLARVLHENNITLVYGGGTGGLMGEVARTLVSLSGPESVHGIIPRPLIQYERKPGPNEAVTNTTPGNNDLPTISAYGTTTIVEDMHTRKRLMAEKVMGGGSGSGFVALSGGFGTLEELMEMITWNQLGIHDRGVVALNIEGFWDGVLDWVRSTTRAGFIKEANAGIVIEVKTAVDAIQALKDYRVSSARFGLNWKQS